MSEYEEVMKVLFDRGLPSETCGKVAGVFNEVKRLERQLEEAREFAEEMLDSGYFESSIGLIYVKRLEQLKEKGE